MHMPEGELPMQSWNWRPKAEQRDPDFLLPEIQLFVGRDLRSSGASLWVWEPTDGSYPRRRLLYASRWLEPILTTEGALRIAARAAAAALAELFGPEIPA
jgi:hypothetical protein